MNSGFISKMEVSNNGQVIDTINFNDIQAYENIMKELNDKNTQTIRINDILICDKSTNPFTDIDTLRKKKNNKKKK